MRSFNLFHGELVDRRDRPGFSWRRTAVGRAIGAEKLGASVYELEPGERSFPYHYEYGNEEWLIVVAGHPTLRDPEGEHVLEPGDVVCFREGPDGAHQMRNDAVGVVRFLILSTKVSPDMAIYPDSNKVGVWSGKEDVDPGRLFLLADEVDYWDGET